VGIFEDRVVLTVDQERKHVVVVSLDSILIGGEDIRELHVVLFRNEAELHPTGILCLGIFTDDRIEILIAGPLKVVARTAGAATCDRRPRGLQVTCRKRHTSENTQGIPTSELTHLDIFTNSFYTLDAR